MEIRIPKAVLRPTGESYESFDRKRALVKYQSQSEVIKVMLYVSILDVTKVLTKFDVFLVFLQKSVDRTNVPFTEIKCNLK